MYYFIFPFVVAVVFYFVVVVVMAAVVIVVLLSLVMFCFVSFFSLYQKIAKIFIGAALLQNPVATIKNTVKACNC